MERTAHPEPKRLDTCQNCAYLDVLGQGYCCRRYPPTVTTIIVPEADPISRQMMATMRNQAALPSVTLNEWCGEWKANA